MNKSSLRKRAPSGSYEPEEPALDEYIYCEKCTDFVYEYCSIHGPLLIIPDDKVPSKTSLPSFVPRAALTMPRVFLHLAPSIIPGAGLGVFSTLTLPRGIRFGPYRGQCSRDISSMYCWQMYNRNHKPSHVVDADDTNKSNWMRYVNCARHCREQNLVAYQYQGQLYYRTIKTIPRFTELMVFYGSEFANQLQIDLRRYTLEEHYERIVGASRKIENGLTDETTEVIETEDNVSNSYKETVASSTLHEEIINNTLMTKDQSHITNNLQIEEGTVSTYNVSYNDSNECFQLEFHDENINKSKPQCHHCKKLLSSKSCLNKHLLIHSDIKPYKCKQCNYKTSNEYNLARHTRTHERNTYEVLRTQKVIEQMIFKCDECEKYFKNQKTLNRHGIIHSDNDKIYKCSYCDFKTVYKKNHKRHTAQHTKGETFACAVCTYTSYLKCNLNTHIRRMHDNFFYEKNNYKK